MNWMVRVRSRGMVVPDIDTIETFLDGFGEGLRAAGQNVGISSDTDRLVDVQLVVTTERRAISIAKALVAALQREFPRATFQVTLTVDVQRLGGAA